MKLESPFPGMDPFIEARHLWKGIHTQIIGDLSMERLPSLLSPAYYVDVEPSLQIRTDHNLYPDLQIMVATPPYPINKPSGLGMPVAAETGTITNLFISEMDEEEERAIFVREVGTERLVTVIEILSYSNKTKGRKKYDQYVKKRQEFLSSGIHLVEVDLLRWGRRVVDELSDQPYHILISRGDEQPKGHVWSFGFQEPIPNVPLPLVAPDEYVPLLLQETFQKIYQARNFRQRLNYLNNPTAPLTEAQQLTIHQQLVNVGLRIDTGGRTNGCANDCTDTCTDTCTDGRTNEKLNDNN